MKKYKFLVEEINETKTHVTLDGIIAVINKKSNPFTVLIDGVEAVSFSHIYSLHIVGCAGLSYHPTKDRAIKIAKKNLQVALNISQQIACNS